ncbi:MAG: glycoside hydrolase family 172 protein [Chloroflexota bacterium]|nr:glycoside hydrolase family 172 protein [Chloroflexota bacterium]
MIGNSTLAGLARLRPGVKRMRASSYDPAGGNSDWWEFAPGQKRDIGALIGAGCIKHIWCTMWSHDAGQFRKVVLRMFWDGEDQPSVEVPIGDFFGMGHNLTRNFVSLPLQMSPENGRSFNCWFPMPYQSGARIEIENECDKPLNFYFYIDYEAYPSETDMSEYARFHAQWRRVDKTPGWADPSVRWSQNNDAMREAWKTPNLTGENNYIILEAAGRGHYVGCHLDVDCFERQSNDWYGEGDDMIIIDGEPLPRLYGTGTEDYFNTAFCPTQEYSAPYHGVILYQGTEDWRWRGKNTLYRYHVEDPIFFEQSIKVTIEHGHANKLSNDYSSTAYWYQTEPHQPFPTLLTAAARMPR